VPVYRLHSPGQPPELLEADSARVEGIHTVLRGTALVMGRPREVVLRRVPAVVRVEVLDASDSHEG
jgi:hypothetical protein